MSIWTIILVAVFVNATDPPRVMTALLAPDTECNLEIAHEVADQVMKGAPYTDLNYSCNDAEGPGEETPPPPAQKHPKGSI